MIRIFMNGLAASAGAGLTYLHNVVPQLSALPEVHTSLAVQPSLSQSFEQLRKVDLVCPKDISGTARRFWFEQWKLPSLISEVKADVLISAGNIALRKSPVPQILLSGNSLYTCAEFSRDLRARREYALLADNFVKSALARKSVYWADQTIAPSQAFADELRRWTGREVAVIHHGFDPQIFFGSERLLSGEIQQKLGETKGCLRLLFVSHYNYYRNFETLLRAVPLIQKLMPGRKIKLLLTCKLEPDGAYDGRSAGRLVHDLGIEDCVVQLGVVPYAALHHLYRACDVYVTPAYAETFAHPLVEAMASGLPVVASNFPAHTEVCGDAARYFAPFSAESLANALVSALDPEVRLRLAFAGKARANDFSWSKHVNRLLQIAAELREGLLATSKQGKLSSHAVRSRRPCTEQEYSLTRYLPSGLP